MLFLYLKIFEFFNNFQIRKYEYCLYEKIKVNDN